MIDKTQLDNVIIGRVEPHIYAFITNTIPNYLKIGDTYRSVNVRLNEWREVFPKLEKKFEDSAKINDDIYFRDFAVHQFLERDKKRIRLQPSDIGEDIYYSKEFFKDTTPEDIYEAISDIKKDFDNKTQKYQFYNAVNKLPEKMSFERNENYSTRPNQDATIDKFKTAYANGRSNLLMYAVMRFGKSFTSMCCAVEMDAKLVVIVSAKADVELEWEKTVESHIKFADYDFLTSKDLKENNNAINEKFNSNRKVAIFLTLQDLQGETIKDKHKELFGEKIGLLLIDETHFGARADKYGQVLKTINYEKDIKNKNDNDDFVDVEEAEEQLKVLDAKVKLHLSGTPYRILMGSEFKKEDIIAFYQFTDIVKDQQDWISENNKKPENEQEEDWANPYFGFPQMVRFAFNPNESSRKRLEELRKNGISYAFSALLKPKSIKKADNGDNKKFIYEQEVLDLLEVIDGTKEDNELLGFLDYDKIKEGKMCRHIVIVLPYCSSCDALEELIKTNKNKFKNLNSYEIINISGVENPNKYKTTLAVKKAISNFESQGKKTITLTVNRMLTGSTVQEWDTMIYLKDTSSPQEYDQAIFRLQNQYVKTFEADNGEKIKYNMKPQTLLVDFMPNRMFIIQEQKAQIYNVNIDDGGNNKLKQRIEEELKISPIITINSNKIKEVQATDILEAVSNYKMDKGIKDEALEIPVDLAILEIPKIKAVIESENEIGSKAGLSIPAHSTEIEIDYIDTTPTEGDRENENKKKETDENTNNSGEISSNDEQQKMRISLTKKIQSYYTRILLLSFITKDIVVSLKDIIDKIDDADNKRIASNLGLDKSILNSFYDFYFKHNKWILRELDYKIQDLNNLTHNDELSSEEKASVAVNKFGKLGDAVVITPSNICDDMINLLPNEVFENGKNVLDIAGVSGEFATAIVKKMTFLGIDDNVIKNSVYTITKTSICYELTRKVYEMLNLNTDNIATFYAEDLLKIETNNKIDYEKIKKLISQNKPFNEIKLTDNIEGEIEMLKFDAIVGNPPYQEGRKSIFHYFQILADYLNPKYSCLIYPGKRWIHQAGKGMDEFGKKLINDKKLAKLIFYPNSKNVFESVDVSDGISIVLKDFVNQYEKINYTYILNDECINVNYTRPEDKMLSLCPKDFIIIKKIENFVEKNNLKWLHDSVSDQKYFGVESNFVEENKQFVKPFTTNIKMKKNEIQLLTNDKSGPGGRSKCFVVDRNLITKNTDSIDKWKVVVSSAHPGGQDGRDNQLSILGPKTAFGRARVSLKIFDSKMEAENCYKYIKSKAVQYFLLLSDEALSSFAKNVPDLLDYTKNNKLIDFARPIDEQLYNLIDLDDKEIKYIENKINPME